MNQTVYPANFDARAAADITAAFTSIITGGADAISITLQTPTPGSSTFDTTTGITGSAHTIDVVTGTRSVITDIEQTIDTPYQLGDIRFTVMDADLTTDPITGDSSTLITVEGRVYQVISACKDSLGNAWTLTGRATT